MMAEEPSIPQARTIPTGKFSAENSRTHITAGMPQFIKASASSIYRVSSLDAPLLDYIDVAGI